MAGQATGKRQHLPIRMRMHYQQVGGDALLLDTRIGTWRVGSAQDMSRQWRPGVRFDAIVAVAAGSEIHRLLVGGNRRTDGAGVELSDGNSLSYRVTGLRFLEAVPVLPTADQLALVSEVDTMQFPLFAQASFRNDSLK